MEQKRGVFFLFDFERISKNEKKKKKLRPKKKEERKNVNETLVPRGVLLHVMTLLSLVASREREREREREI